MTKRILLIVLIAIGFQFKSFSQEKPLNITGISDDSKYGYTEKKPIMAGSIPNGYTFLNLLQGPNGETIMYKREGSCCGFKTKNSPFGQGFLDTYSVWYEGGKKVTLYINGYDFAPQQCPKGFTYKEE